MKAERFDVAILGTGITGSILGALLARNGVKTLLIEQGTHPRFAIGESTVPETTFQFRLLAARYDVPELANLSTYYKMRRNVTSTCGVKRNFSFVFHRRGKPHVAKECSQMPTLSPPLGPDMHMFRQDVDAYLLSVAGSYGATIRQRTDVTDVAIGNHVILRTRQGPTYESEYVVDAGGIKAPLAQFFGLRENPPSLLTHSRAIYTHMLGVRPLDACMASAKEHGLPSPLSQGTAHHIFEGGWMWVIPFNNHPKSINRLCSVGLTLDPRIHPSKGLPPDEEFREFIRDIPVLAAQFEHASAIREWMSTDRLQFSSTQGVGERYCLMPHAFAFVDALFSTGLTMSMGAINMLASRLIRAKSDGDYSLERFAPIGDRMKANVDYFDRLVSRSYFAFSNFELWNAWYRVWALGTVYGALGMLEILGRYLRSRDKACFEACEQAPYAGAQATELPEYIKLFEAACREVDAARDGHLTPENAALRVFDHLSSSGIWPRPWGRLQSDVRHPGIFTLPELLPFLRWVQSETPPRVRESYFVHFGVPEMLSLVRDDWASEIRYSLGSIALLARDFARGYNRDWTKI
jgi:FADH2 O2-dependent halogenase